MIKWPAIVAGKWKMKEEKKKNRRVLWWFLPIQIIYYYTPPPTETVIVNISEFTNYEIPVYIIIIITFVLRMDISFNFQQRFHPNTHSTSIIRSLLLLRVCHFTTTVKKGSLCSESRNSIFIIIVAIFARLTNNCTQRKTTLQSTYKFSTHFNTQYKSYWSVLMYLNFK